MMLIKLIRSHTITNTIFRILVYIGLWVMSCMFFVGVYFILKFIGDLL